MHTLKRTACVLLVAAMLFSVVTITALDSSALAPLPHKVQYDDPWGSVVVGYGNISGTGCGILSLVNAVGYLTGKEMDVIETAKWAYSVNGFNNINGNLGTYRLVLYPKVQAEYGEEYGFTVDCNTENNGWWAGANSKVLKEHLANGGVAIGNIPNHFIAIVDYNAETNMFHVLDSAPTADRGTMEKRGDVWLSESHMSTGNYKLGWFCLLSATGIPADEQDNEREFLGNAIELAKDLRFYNFNAETLGAFRTAYANATAIYNSDSAASEECTAARNALVSALEASSAISVGKSYVATPNERTDIYKDDGKKLTDGKKGQLPADTEVYSGLGNKVDSVITVDLGTAPSAHNTYRVFAASNDNWGIGKPNTVKVAVSNNGTDFEEIATTSVVWSVAKKGDWTTYVMNLQAENDRTERYVRFTVTPNGHTWLDEVEVCGGTPIDLEGSYITAVNKKIGSGDCNIFTPAFGECSVSTVNYLYGYSLVLKWSESDNAYRVTYSGFGTAIEAVRGETFVLADDEILVVAHEWEEGVTENAVYGSGTNYKKIMQVEVGDLITLSGIDVAGSSCSAASYITVHNSTSLPEPEYALGDVNADGNVDSADYLIVKRACFGGYALAEGESKRADVDGSDNVDSADYVLVKRLAFGTY